MKSKKPLTSTERSRKARAADPVRYSYVSLRNNAKRRGKVFTITLDYFKQFCYATDYLKGKGRTATSYTVDRIDESKGYEPGNIQVLPLVVNIKKYLNYDWQTGTATVVTVRRSTEWAF